MGVIEIEGKSDVDDLKQNMKQNMQGTCKKAPNDRISEESKDKPSNNQCEAEQSTKICETLSEANPNGDIITDSKDTTNAGCKEENTDAGTIVDKQDDEDKITDLAVQFDGKINITGPDNSNSGSVLKAEKTCKTIELLKVEKVDRSDEKDENVLAERFEQSVTLRPEDGECLSGKPSSSSENFDPDSDNVDTESESPSLIGRHPYNGVPTNNGYVTNSVQQPLQFIYTRSQASRQNPTSITLNVPFVSENYQVPNVAVNVGSKHPRDDEDDSVPSKYAYYINRDSAKEAVENDEMKYLQQSNQTPSNQKKFYRSNSQQRMSGGVATVQPVTTTLGDVMDVIGLQTPNQNSGASSGSTYPPPKIGNTVSVANAISGPPLMASCVSPTAHQLPAQSTNNHDDSVTDIVNQVDNLLNVFFDNPIEPVFDNYTNELAPISSNQQSQFFDGESFINEIQRPYNQNCNLVRQFANAEDYSGLQSATYNHSPNNKATISQQMVHNFPPSVGYGSPQNNGFAGNSINARISSPNYCHPSDTCIGLVSAPNAGLTEPQLHGENSPGFDCVASPSAGYACSNKHVEGPVAACQNLCTSKFDPATTSANVTANSCFHGQIPTTCHLEQFTGYPSNGSQIPHANGLTVADKKSSLSVGSVSVPSPETGYDSSVGRSSPAQVSDAWESPSPLSVRSDSVFGSPPHVPDKGDQTAPYDFIPSPDPVINEEMQKFDQILQQKLTSGCTFDSHESILKDLTDTCSFDNPEPSPSLEKKMQAHLESFRPIRPTTNITKTTATPPRQTQGKCLGISIVDNQCPTPPTIQGQHHIERTSLIEDKTTKAELQALSYVASLSLEQLKRVDEDKDTFLHIAIQHHRPPLLKALLSRMQKENCIEEFIDAKNRDSQTALYVAVAWPPPENESDRRYEMVASLLHFGANVNVSCCQRKQGPSCQALYQSSLHMAASSCNHHLLRLLLSKDSSGVNGTNSLQCTPLHCAVKQHGKNGDCRETLKLLASYKADLGAKISNGKTVFHMITEDLWDLDLLKFLVSLLPRDRVAQVLNLQDDNGNSALHLLMGCPNRHGSPHSEVTRKAMLSVFLEQGADPKIRNSKHESPAALTRDQTLINMLKSKSTSGSKKQTGHEERSQQERRGPVPIRMAPRSDVQTVPVLRDLQIQPHTNGHFGTAPTPIHVQSIQART